MASQKLYNNLITVTDAGNLGIGTANPGVTPARPACPSIIMTCNYVGKD